ncbi:MAG: hypothetical protein AAFX78_09905 [Cyanobacteria bacterium J06638_20]
MTAFCSRSSLLKPTTAVVSTGILWLLAIASAQAASPIALSFELEDTSSSAADSTPTTIAATAPSDLLTVPPDKTRLTIPPSATNAPIGTGHELAELPPPPQMERVAELPPPPVTAGPVAPVAPPEPEPAPMATLTASDAGGISFQLPAWPQQILNLLTGRADADMPSQPASDPAALPETLVPLFAGGSQSLVAIAVGNAEGTRTPTGDITPAYYGHVDPGNGAWNLGSFSYQHGAPSPEEADQHQLVRLQQQAIRLWHDAERRGLQLSTEAWLNAIDLANQAPEAALEPGGYLDRLQEAHRLNLADVDAIAWARTRSYIDPDTQQWNAPGLGNTLAGVTADQERRMRAIARAISTNTTSMAQHESVVIDQLLSTDLD